MGRYEKSCAISLALRRKGDGTLPRDFTRFSRCRFSEFQIAMTPRKNVRMDGAKRKPGFGLLLVCQMFPRFY